MFYISSGLVLQETAGMFTCSPLKILTAMYWDFIKKRWFTIALLLILLIAAVRKNLHFDGDDTAAPVSKERPEIYTEEPASPKSASMLNLGSEATTSKVQLPEIDEATAIAFLQRFGNAMAAEQQKFGVPASVLLACAYVNSFSGRRSCAREVNNYLAIPCTKDWNGSRANFNGSCFREYATAWESIRGFSLYLQQKPWFASLKKSAGQDWKAWVKGLAKHDLSDVQQFETELVRVIEAYRLYELDQFAN
ncbi:MAG: glucosaminidase domain-containing protein [Lewinellaceae bacterium]|nr:glucosaminidase domain-containing protein [Saprospiraceae bacterium]MCB9316793.1 glucosaminidase domain-containing protein [Lewinellaceae bacterium]